MMPAAARRALGVLLVSVHFFFFSSRRRHTRLQGDWSSDVCSSDLCVKEAVDNALDAAEEAGILPDVVVTLEVVATDGTTPPASQATRFRVTVIDNGDRKSVV